MDKKANEFIAVLLVLFILCKNRSFNFWEKSPYP